MQINEEVRIWSEGSNIVGAAFIGGANVKRQLEKLKKHPQDHRWDTWTYI